MYRICCIVTAFFAAQCLLSQIACSQSQQFELDNGLVVILIPLPTAKTNALLLLYDIGNQYDPAGKSGMSHLAEHLFVTAATENTRARNVRQYMAAYPDGWNAQTGDRYTVFATVFKADRTADEIAEAADRMSQLKIVRADLDRELPRIDQELANMYGGLVPLALSNHARHNRRPLAHNGRRGGKIDELKTVSLAEIQSWLDHYYKAGNATLLLAGVFEPETVKKLIREKFSSIAAGQKPEIQQTLAANSEPLEIKIAAMQAGQKARVGYCFTAPAPDDPLYAAFQVHATRMMLAAQKVAGRSAGGMADLPFMFRPLDDPDFFYASMAIEPNSTPPETFEKLDEFLASQRSVKFQSFHVAQARSQLAMFLGTQELPPQMLAFNPYGAAFSLGRRRQMGIDSKKLAKAFENIDALQMEQAAQKLFSAENRIAVTVRLK